MIDTIPAVIRNAITDLLIDYDELDAYLTDMSEDPDVVELFDNLYARIRHECQR